jgi:hypothetical protein
VELETFPGVLIANGGDIWTLHEEKVEVSTIACSFEDDDAEPREAPKPGHVTRLSLVLAGSEVEQRIIEPEHNAEGAEEFEHDAHVVASIGPYLFLEQSSYAYACGAHGSSAVAALIWDAGHEAVLDRPDDLGPVEASRDQAIAELLDGDDDLFAPTAENTELTELIPRFDRDAALRLGLQFTAPTCYACTRGGWGSYTKSTTVDARSLPAVFAPYASAPDAVRAFVKAHPAATLGGWSHVSR